MAETQIELTPEEEARIKWEGVLLGKTQAIVEPVLVEETAEAEVDSAPLVLDNGPEAVLARLYKSMVAA